MTQLARYLGFGCFTLALTALGAACSASSSGGGADDPSSQRRHGKRAASSADEGSAEAAGGEDRRRAGGGFPIGNFGICGQITGGGAFLSRIMVNPSREGPWLEELPGGRLLIECGGQARATEEFASVRAERAFPFASLEVSDPGTPGVRARIRSFSPVARQDAFRTSLPVILAEITLTSERDEAMDVSAVFAMGAGHALMELSLIHL